ncbi:hypothetical protein VNO80_21744 [Phaseolus coccineus]|uniref:Uncharacterized protein n=1 Tax=Phaseolus coccineus TaxID=3886 RepID=A0AAN9M3M5_PHACN
MQNAESLSTFFPLEGRLKIRYRELPRGKRIRLYLNRCPELGLSGQITRLLPHFYHPLTVIHEEHHVAFPQFCYHRQPQSPHSNFFHLHFPFTLHCSC